MSYRDEIIRRCLLLATLLVWGSPEHEAEAAEEGVGPTEVHGDLEARLKVEHVVAALGREGLQR